MIAIIDYDAGNIKSVEKALLLLGQQVVITRDKETILNAAYAYEQNSDSYVNSGLGVE